MGSQHGRSTSVMDAKIVKSLITSTPLRSLDQQETEVHEIISLSPEHHQIMLQKIRIKKNYDCPYLIKIIDSHTLESKNLCSTLIKVYIVIEKPESLAEEIQQRISMSMGFEQSQLWTLIYSCCMAALYLLNNNVSLIRLNSSKIFIDLKGGIKINDPDFVDGMLSFDRITQSEFVQNLSDISRDLMKIKNLEYSKNLEELVELMHRPSNSLDDVLQYIKVRHLTTTNKDQCIDIFSSARKKQRSNKSRQKLRILSGRKSSNCSYKSHTKNNFSDFTNVDSLSSYREEVDKENLKSNQASSKKNRVDLFTFKDPLKGIQNISNSAIQVQSHLFPKKALFGQRKRSDKMKQSVNAEKFHNTFCSRTSIKNDTRQDGSLAKETDQSLIGSQLLNIVSYQVDQETSVRQVGHQHSQYFLELMNQMRYSANSLRNQSQC